MMQQVFTISHTNRKTKLSRVNYILRINNALILNFAGIFAMYFLSAL